MKAVIPLAGKGTRLRPHTHLMPKPLLRVAGTPILDCILDDLLAAGAVALARPWVEGRHAGGAIVRGFHGALNVSDHSEVLSPGDGVSQS